MAKSAGNFYTLRDIVEKGYDPAAIRYSLINTHYRQQLNFTLEGIDAAKQAIGRLRDFNRSLREASAAQDSPEAPALLSRMVEAFDAAMDDDLNISLGLSAVFEFVREVNRLSLSAADAAKIQAAIRRLDGILGVLGRDDVMLDEEIERLIGEREQARKSRNFPRADAIREQLRNRGILLEDTPRGVRWKRA
jgi:cysteinyl-tRNA synthetase